MDDRKAGPRKSIAAPRKKRRMLKATLTLIVLGSSLVATLPWLLGTRPARNWIVGQINARLAPGSIRLGELGLSWGGPIRLDGVALFDPAGKTVLASDRVIIDRGILGLIASQPDYGTITIEGASVDVERKADGTIDVLEALAGVLKPEERTGMPPAAAPQAIPVAPEKATASPSLTVVLKGGTLKAASPELVEPFAADTLAASLKVSPGRPVELSIDLGGEGRSIEVRSTLDAGNLAASVVGKAWPIHVRQSGVEAKGLFDGRIDAKRERGLWSLKADSAISGLEAAGPALRGDRLKLDRVGATCDVGETAAGWAIRTLDVSSPVATLRGIGTIPATDGTSSHVEGKVDLAALAKMVPNAMALRDNLSLDRGTATLRLDVSAREGVERFELVAGIDHFAATESGREVRLRHPVSLTGRATRSGEKVAVETVEVKAAGVEVKGSGDLRGGVKLSGTVDLAPLMDQVRDVLDPGPFDVSGHIRLAADYRHFDASYKGRFAVESKGLKVKGVTANPIERDQTRFEGWVVGPGRADGVPGGWHQARIDLKAGATKLDLQADNEGSNPSIVAAFETPVDSPMAGRLDARAKVRKSGTAIDFDELAVGFTPADPKSESERLDLAIRGQFDPTHGEGMFLPITRETTAAIGLGPEGVKISGVGRADLPMKIDAALMGDLATVDHLVAAWTGAKPKGLGGAYTGRWGVSRAGNGKVEVVGKVIVADLITSAVSKGPVSIALKAAYAPELDRLDLPSVELATRFGRVEIVAGLAEIKARRFFDITATVEPEWAAIDPIITASVEPTAHVRATVRPIHLAGMLRADSTPQLLGQIVGEVGLDLTTATAFGLDLGPTPVVLKLGNGLAKFDPIRSTLNGGEVSIVADLALDGDFGVWLRVGSSKVEGATINEALSDSILAFVAPVLANSSQVSGKVAVAIDRAFVPITATGPLALDGALALQNVTFDPGPLASELNSLTGQSMHSIRLNEAMFVKVADRRVEQHGLSIPVGGNGLKVAIDGSVGFDETLDLKATVPLTPKALGLATTGDSSAAGASASLPIRGTLARPTVDRKALSVALRDAAKAFGEKRLKSEAGRLLERIAGPSQSSGEPRTKAPTRNPLGDLEGLGREILNPQQP